MESLDIARARGRPWGAGEAAFPQVAAQMRSAIAQGPDLPVFRDLLHDLLGQPGRVLAARGPAKWPAFVLDTCRVLGGDPAAATVAAAAVEFGIAAADIVDDLVDDDWDRSRGDWRRALNASLALTSLAQGCVGRLAGFIGAARAVQIGELVAQYSLAASAGQDLDLLLEAQPAGSEDTAHAMTLLKAGSAVSLACQIGAALASEDQAIVAQVGQFGEHVGIVAQLLNDLRGIDPDAPVRSSDLRRGKKTVPVVYALRCAREEGLTELLELYGRVSGAERGAHAEDEARLARMIRDLGAMHYTYVVADVHRRRALAVLAALRHATGRAEVRALRRLVPPVQLRST